MSDVVIRVENLSKKYVIGHAKGGSSGDGLRHAVQNAIAGPWRALQKSRKRKAESGNGESSTDFSSQFSTSNSSSEEFYALRNVSFELKRGDVLGIIGRNGAGKSTILKILSRITEPTDGRIGIKGRVASLLEVGTGFHPELTGRENIFLNGAILGMTQAEVRRKFDEIVDFSGIIKFVNTPVKRYSSGMYVRLAFAVAAHLEPEILIVDEVLAVGDLTFQKKCIGKMQNIADEGRTVLFVSHDLTAIERLCSRTVLMDEGSLVLDASTPRALAAYQQKISTLSSSDLALRSDRTGRGAVRFTRIQLMSLDETERSVFGAGESLRIRLSYRSAALAPLRNSRVSVSFHGWGKVYFLASTELYTSESLTLPSNGYIDCIITELPLTLGLYYLNPYLEVDGVAEDTLESATTLTVEGGNFYGTGKDYPPGWNGKTVLVRHRWELPTACVSAS